MDTFERDRRAKMDSLRAEGIDSFSLPRFTPQPIDVVRAKFDATKNKEDGELVAVGGRVALRRGQGKLSFITLTGETGKIQLALDVSHLSPRAQKTAKGVDLGDIVVAHGNLCSTKTGEVTVWVREFYISGKALTPPPDKHNGLSDPELRYRHRHVDMWTNPDTMRVLQARSKIVRAIRNFFHEEGYLEVETPMMQPVAGGAAAKPFKTHHNALDIDLYLRIAPELYLKRLLIGGMTKVFEIGRNFRNEGISPRHNPEFTALEAYQAFGNYETMMKLLEKMLDRLAFRTHGKYEVPYRDGVIDFKPPFRRVRLDELVSGTYTPEERQAIYENEIEPTLMNPTFVTHMPASSVPLAKRDGDCAEVFELVIGGQEVAPGYTELNDPDVQLENFKAQSKDGHCLDLEFVEAMKVGMPPAGGLGLGIDRLVAILTNQTSVRDVIAFPLLRPNVAH